jgi:Uncharacterized alpha/beta hydrolase domain (DUF2235)
MNERRRYFFPTQCKLAEGNNTTKLKEVWFPGVHSSVGGGQPHDHPLSLVACTWMMEQVHNSTDLRFDLDFVAAIAFDACHKRTGDIIEIDDDDFFWISDDPNAERPNLITDAIRASITNPATEQNGGGGRIQTLDLIKRLKVDEDSDSDSDSEWGPLGRLWAKGTQMRRLIWGCGGFRDSLRHIYILMGAKGRKPWTLKGPEGLKLETNQSIHVSAIVRKILDDKYDMYHEFNDVPVENPTAVEIIMATVAYNTAHNERVESICNAVGVTESKIWPEIKGETFAAHTKTKEAQDFYRFKKGVVTEDPRQRLEDFKIYRKGTQAQDEYRKAFAWLYQSEETQDKPFKKGKDGAGEWFLDDEKFKAWVQSDEKNHLWCPAVGMLPLISYLAVLIMR